MKRIYFILIIVLVTLVVVTVNASETQANQVTERVFEKVYATLVQDSTMPIIKTIVIDEEEEGEDLFSSQNKWITIGLAVFGIILVVIMRMFRKRKSKH